MPRENLDHVWHDIKANADVPNEYWIVCMGTLNKLWKGWKHRVKKHYYNTFKSDSDRLSNLPDRVEPSQWPILVRYWGLPKTQQAAAIGKNSREHQEALNRTGRKSHPRVARELEKSGKLIDEVSIWTHTRAKKDKSDGIYSKEDGAEYYYTELQSKLNEYPEEQRNNKEGRKKVFHEVMGDDKYGRTRLLGSVGASAKVIRTETLANAMADKKIEAMRVEMENKIKEMEQRVSERESAVQAQQTQFMDKVCSVLLSAGLDLALPTPPCSVQGRTRTGNSSMNSAARSSLAESTSYGQECHGHST